MFRMFSVTLNASARSHRTVTALLLAHFCALAIPAYADPTDNGALDNPDLDDPPIVIGAGWRSTVATPPAFFWLGSGTIFNREGPFTFTAATAVEVSITDDFCTGDQFRIYDFGVPIGDTSPPASPTCPPAVGPDAAFADPKWSSGTFSLGPGPHSITIQVIVNPFGGGRGYIRVDAPNDPPVCNADGPYFAECQGDVTSVRVDGTGSTDPDEDPLSYLWTTDCPGASFDDPTLPAPTLSVDTSTAGPVVCNVTLVVSDGRAMASCFTAVQISGCVPVDIKPQSCPNTILSNQGLISVSIAGTESFDATQVDPTTVRLVGVPHAPINTAFAVEDAATPVAPFLGKEDCLLDCTQAGADGIPDLTLKFDTEDVLDAITAPLFGVTGDGAPADPESFFRVSTFDASASLIQPLGNGSGGESIAFNPADGLMYHWSGFSSNANQVMETIDINDGTVTNVPTDFSQYDPQEVWGSTYDPSTGNFLIVDINQNLASVTPSGSFSVIGPLSTWLRGMAFVRGNLYAGEQFDSDQLHEINPLTGATISTVTVTLPGFTVKGINGLSVHPKTGILYGILKTTAASIPGRRLATIDPLTGATTDIGPLPDGIANIEFGSRVLEDCFTLPLEGELFSGARIVGEDVARVNVVPGRPTILLASTNQGELVKVNLATNRAKLIGREPSPGGWTGLSLDTSGNLYAVSRHLAEPPSNPPCSGFYDFGGGCAHLYRVDINTGAALEHVGDLQGMFVSDIEFAGGTLFANYFVNERETGDGSLATIDLSTGSLTPATSLFDRRNGLENGGLAVHPETGELWAVENSFAFSGSGRTPSIFRVNPYSGQAVASSNVELGLDGVPARFGFDSLEILPDRTFLGTRGGGSSTQLYEIDPVPDADSGLAEVTLIPLDADVTITGKINGLEHFDP